jgi:hypothetical protein
MSHFLRFRYLVFLPFALLLAGTWLGGFFLNTVDAGAVVVDSSTGEPVSGVVVAFGDRHTTTDAEGRYALTNLPRGARILITPPFSYSDQTVDPSVTRVELAPSSMNITVLERNVVPAQPVKSAQVRQGDKLLGTGSDSGAIVVAPYPEVGSKLLVCAPDHRSQEIEARGTQINVGLVSGGDGCPPLPSPSPSGSPSPTPSPSGPAPTASPAPSSTP